MTAIPISSSASSRQFSAGPDIAAIPTTAGTGLKVPSIVRFDKLATLDRSVIAGKIAADWLHAHRAVFFGVFGFGRPSTA
jgi:mRNA interferase MazF